jgi:putative sterol carrier protein/GNAT superfamily N-acetyltransferase
LSYSYRRFHEGDEAAVEELLKITFPCFKEENLWYWKYKLNPCFGGSLLVVAEKDNEIIGSNSWLLRDIKLQGTLQVKAALGADVAVHPKYRGSGIGTELLRYPRLSGTFKEYEVLLSYMFGRPELSKRFYEPAAGYIVAPNGTITYKKLLSCNPFQKKFQEIEQAVESNEALKRKLKDLTMCISLRLKGAPEFSVHIEPEKVYLTEGATKKPDVIIEASLQWFYLVINESVGMVDLVKALLTGKFKVKKGLLHVFKIRKVFKLFQKELK